MLVPLFADLRRRANLSIALALPRLRVANDVVSGASLFFVIPEDPPMTRRRQIYEGKAKILYEGPEPGTIIQYFKDDATAFNAQKKGTINGKGVINNRISEHVFTLLNNIGIPHHFLKRLNMREQLVRQVEIIPIEVVIRNVAAGSLSKRLGIEEGTPLSRTIIEYYYKDDALGDPLITDEHIACFGWASQEEMHDIADMAIRVNDFMSGMFAGIGIRLVDFKLEFGRVFDGDFSRVILADEISPDGCRLWDMVTNEKLDKDRFRRDLGGEAEAYQEVARRMGLLPDGVDSAVLDLETHRKKRGK
jgi:phosphoribosylaminoimidazole-succinocarboxamide synthase